MALYFKKNTLLQTVSLAILPTGRWILKKLVYELALKLFSLKFKTDFKVPNFNLKVPNLYVQNVFRITDIYPAG